MSSSLMGLCRNTLWPYVVWVQTIITAGNVRRPPRYCLSNYFHLSIILFSRSHSGGTQSDCVKNKPSQIYRAEYPFCDTHRQDVSLLAWLKKKPLPNDTYSKGFRHSITNVSFFFFFVPLSFSIAGAVLSILVISCLKFDFTEDMPLSIIFKEILRT